MRSNNASFVVGVLVFLLALAAVTVHSPGQVSMDTSVQLYEAHIGRSVSWNPPFMSAVLRWFGGGELATAAMVFLNTVLIYGSLAVVANRACSARVVAGYPNIAVWRSILAWILVINPIIAIYVGIVWKDVFFASLLVAGCAAGISAAHGVIARRIACVLLSVVCLSGAMLARQQGIFMAPLLLLVPIIAIFPKRKYQQLFCLASIVALFLAVTLCFQWAVKTSIQDEGGRSSSVGYRSIMIFDLAGIVANSSRPSDQFVYPITADQVLAVRSTYEPSRIDYLSRNPSALAWLNALSMQSLGKAWLSMVMQNPLAYGKHRISAYATLLGLRGISATLPVHIGVDGNEAYLATVGLPVVRDRRDLLLYQIASSFFNWPIYRHAFWISVLAVIVIGARNKVFPPRYKAIFYVVAIATTLLYASYFPTMISSDFRYLFAGIPLITILCLMVLLGARRRNLNTSDSQLKPE